jgi:hypothetical protein
MRCVTATLTNLRCYERFLDAHRPRRRALSERPPGHPRRAPPLQALRPPGLPISTPGPRPRRLRARPRLLSRRARRPSRRLPAVRGVPARPVRSMDHRPSRAGFDRRSARPSLRDLACPRYRRAPSRHARTSQRTRARRPNQSCGRSSLSSSGSARASLARSGSWTRAPVRLRRDHLFPPAAGSVTAGPDSKLLADRDVSLTRSREAGCSSSPAYESRRPGK